jgi:serine protease Do
LLDDLDKAHTGGHMNKRFPAYLVIIIIALSAVAILAAARLRQGGPQPISAAGPSSTHQAAAASGDVVGNSVFRDIVRRQNPVVVSITTQSRVRTPQLTQFGEDDFFGRFFGVPMTPREQIQQGLGSGFIISAEGDILTNNHVVAGADRIRVGLFGDERRSYDAKVLGRDPLTDTALIRLEKGPGHLTVATLGDSEALEPGDWVLAIGNPFRLGHTVTAGVVSYKARPFAVTEGRFQNMLQTDASINPGNSGGPLLNMRGEVVGINSAILSGGGAGNIGIGFAVPINAVKALMPELRKGQLRRGRLGVQVQTPPITDDEARELGLPKPEGAIVSTVEPGSPAARAGLQAGDVIVEFNGKTVADGDQLTGMVVTSAVGSRVPVTFYRKGQRQTANVTIEELVLDEEGRQRQGDTSRPGFGLSLIDLTPEIAQQLRLAPGTGGALVEGVEPFAPAANAGLRRGDVIVEVNREPVRSAADAVRLLRQLKPGQTAFVLVSRQGTQLFVTMRTE